MAVISVVAIMIFWQLSSRFLKDVVTVGREGFSDSGNGYRCNVSENVQYKIIMIRFLSEQDRC